MQIAHFRTHFALRRLHLPTLKVGKTYAEEKKEKVQITFLLIDSIPNEYENQLSLSDMHCLASEVLLIFNSVTWNSFSHIFYIFSHIPIPEKANFRERYKVCLASNRYCFNISARNFISMKGATLKLIHV
jgi:hypothetical protein